MLQEVAGSTLVEEILGEFLHARLLDDQDSATSRELDFPTRRFRLGNRGVLAAINLFGDAPDDYLSAEQQVSPEKDPLGWLRKEYPNGAYAPASILIAGNYGVVRGSHGVVLPVPLYLGVGFRVNWSSNGFLPGDISNIGSYVKIRAPDPFSGYSDIVGPRRDGNGFVSLNQLAKRTEEHRKLVEKTETTIQRFLVLADRRRAAAVRSGKDRVKSFELAIDSQFPMKCGLASSGALSAALALALDSYSETDPDGLLRSLGKMRNRTTTIQSRCGRLLSDGFDFELCLQGKSSGVGPFASLAGSVEGLPLYFSSDGKRASDGSLSRLTSVTCKTVTGLSGQRWWNRDLGVAAVFTGRQRFTADWVGREKRLESSTKRIRWKQAVPWMDSAAEKLWENIASQEWEDVTSAIQAAGAYEAGFLGLTHSEGEEQARALMGYFTGQNLGAKYSGAGGGGDLVVVGQSPVLHRALLPCSYYPTHYSSTFIPDPRKRTALPFAWSTE